MCYNRANPYYSPAKFGLVTVDEVEWDGDSYAFNITIIWRHTATGRYYIADDAGCSCPAPFERYELHLECQDGSQDPDPYDAVNLESVAEAARSVEEVIAQLTHVRSRAELKAELDARNESGAASAWRSKEEVARCKSKIIDIIDRLMYAGMPASH